MGVTQFGHNSGYGPTRTALGTAIRGTERKAEAAFYAREASIAMSSPRERMPARKPVVLNPHQRVHFPDECIEIADFMALKGDAPVLQPVAYYERRFLSASSSSVSPTWILSTRSR